MEMPTAQPEKRYPERGLASVKDVHDLLNLGLEKANESGAIFTGQDGTALMMELDLLKDRSRFEGALKVLGDPSEVNVIVATSPTDQTHQDCRFVLARYNSTTK